MLSLLNRMNDRYASRLGVNGEAVIAGYKALVRKLFAPTEPPESKHPSPMQRANKPSKKLRAGN